MLRKFTKTKPGVKNLVFLCIFLPKMGILKIGDEKVHKKS